MWINPRRDELLGHQQGQAEKPTPPEPTGQVLAAFPRRGEAGVEQELRVVLDEYRGHRYLAIRLWQRDVRSGGWWPLKGKGVSVRMAEAQGVAEALQEALEMAGEGRGGYSPDEYPRAGRRQGFALDANPRSGPGRSHSSGEYGGGRGKGIPSADTLPPAPGIGSGPVGDDPGF
jgi:hypothetical protein